MPIKISDCHIENCGVGIKANGEVNIDINNTTFIDNVKDIDLNVSFKSNINIEKIKSINCKTESITYTEYIDKIDNVINKINNIYIENDNKEQIVSRLKIIKENKNNPNYINKILCELYDICKNIGIPIVVQLICKNMGWL